MNQLRSYREVEVGGAARGRLVVMAYDGAITFITRASEALRDGRATDATTLLLRAKRVILYLLSALDHDGGGEVAANLQRLYAYALARLSEAAERRDVKQAAEAARILTELRAAWAQVAWSDAPVPEESGEGRVSVVR